MTRDALLQELETLRTRLRDREREVAVEHALRNKAEREAAERAAEIVAERVLRTKAEQVLAERSAEIERLLAENAELRQRVDLLARKMFGKSSEKPTRNSSPCSSRRRRAGGRRPPRTPARRRSARRRPPLPSPSGSVLAEARTRTSPCARSASTRRPSSLVRLRPRQDAHRGGVLRVVDYVPASCHVVRTVRGSTPVPRARTGS
jgi:hypothetical protein